LPADPAGIVVNLVSYPGFYDVALRNFGRMLAALTLARLAFVYDPALAPPSDTRGRLTHSADPAPSRFPRTAPAASGGPAAGGRPFSANQVGRR
jgi:hypothetical protein